MSEYFEEISDLSAVTKERAMAEIGLSLQEAGQMGGNDSEHARIQEIREKLERGEISPGEAVVEAREVALGKQDYH